MILTEKHEMMRKFFRQFGFRPTLLLPYAKDAGDTAACALANVDEVKHFDERATAIVSYRISKINTKIKKSYDCKNFKATKAPHENTCGAFKLILPPNGTSWFRRGTYRKQARSRRVHRIFSRRLRRG